MNKKIVVLGVAALAASGAMAQSNVQVYGVVDVGYVHFNAQGKDGMHTIDNGMNLPSRLGFKGTEDLGNGLKALFVLEYNIAPDQNSGIGDAASRTRFTGTQARQQYIGLSSPYGTVVAGRLQTTGFDFACTYSPVAGGAFNVTDRMRATTVLNCGTGGRRDNALAYISPTWGGVSFAVNHARVTEEAGTTNVDDAYANLASVSYTHEALKLGAVYSKVSMRNTPAADDIREYGLGGTYDFGVLKAFAMYQNQKVSGQSSDAKWALGVAVPFLAKNTVKLAYGQNRIKSGGLSDADAQAYSVVYNYDLSKRTQLYAGWTHVSNERNGTTAFAGDYVVGNDANGDLVSFGVTHKF
ncbi:MAG: porin [Azonexaceae bacterium]|uniref:porin n=1 Tax=Azonexus sp. R2A61 TaxID=2744443 RepID=UPI001F4843B4|nr:porin [Azonexus sp. R2A61]MCE1241053.1 porin [Azonexaceae bacterium]